MNVNIVVTFDAESGNLGIVPGGVDFETLEGAGMAVQMLQAVLPQLQKILVRLEIAAEDAEAEASEEEVEEDGS